MLAIPTNAAAGGVGTWTRVTDEEAWFELNLLRHDGRLHVGVREDESSLTYRMIHRSISSGGAVGPEHTVAQGFNYLGYYPAFVESGGQLAMNFGAASTGDGYSNSHMEAVVSSDNGESWTAPFDTMVTDGPAESPTPTTRTSTTSVATTSTRASASTPPQTGCGSSTSYSAATTLASTHGR
jgi:hypothetical protein